MQEVLKNMALIELVNYCLAKGIDCSGTICVKDGRGFSYMLVDRETKEPAARVTLTKNSVPRFSHLPSGY